MARRTAARRGQPRAAVARGARAGARRIPVRRRRGPRPRRAAPGQVQRRRDRPGLPQPHRQRRARHERRRGRTGQRGRLSVRARAEGASVVIAIADTGGGIPETVRARIFEPFFTTKPTGPGHRTGTGDRTRDRGRQARRRPELRDRDGRRDDVPHPHASGRARKVPRDANPLRRRRARRAALDGAARCAPRKAGHAEFVDNGHAALERWRGRAVRRRRLGHVDARDGRRRAPQRGAHALAGDGAVSSCPATRRWRTGSARCPSRTSSSPSPPSDALRAVTSRGCRRSGKTTAIRPRRAR